MPRQSATLAVSANDITIASLDDASGARVLTISITPAHLAAQCFTRTPPSAGDVENAIAVVEDAIMLALRNAHPTPEFPPDLQTDTETFTCIAYATGINESSAAPLAIGAIEAAFNQLADIANGAPSSRATLPLDSESVAYLVLLRELMHHLGFSVLRPASS